MEAKQKAYQALQRQLQKAHQSETHDRNFIFAASFNICHITEFERFSECVWPSTVSAFLPLTDKVCLVNQTSGNATVLNFAELIANLGLVAQFHENLIYYQVDQSMFPFMLVN
jgi:hypothetical protein